MFSVGKPFCTDGGSFLASVHVVTYVPRQSERLYTLYLFFIAIPCHDQDILENFEDSVPLAFNAAKLLHKMIAAVICTFAVRITHSSWSMPESS